MTLLFLIMIISSGFVIPQLVIVVCVSNLYNILLFAIWILRSQYRPFDLICGANPS